MYYKKELHYFLSSLIAVAKHSVNLVAFFSIRHDLQKPTEKIM